MIGQIWVRSAWEIEDPVHIDKPWDFLMILSSMVHGLVKGCFSNCIIACVTLGNS